MSEQERLAAAFADAAPNLGQQMNEFFEAFFPGVREARERAGYQGNRCGWYPKRPRQRVGSAAR